MPYQPKKPINEMTMDELIEDLRRRKEYLRKGGDLKVQEKMHKEGMLTARERIDKFLDPGTFVEIDMFVTHHAVGLGMEEREIPAEGIITGYGEVGGRDLYLYSQDYSASGGAIGRWGGLKMVRMYDLAYAKGVPVIAICHGTGARLQESAYGNTGGGVAFGMQFNRIARYSGAIPQIALMMGDNGGGGVYGPGMCDFIIATKRTNMFIAGPPTVKSAIGEEISAEDLGGAEMHAKVSGVVHVLAEDDEDCLKKCRELLSFLPMSCRGPLPVLKTGDDPNRLCPELAKIVPDVPRKPFDVHEVINQIVDSGYFFEIQRDYCKNLIIGFTRFDGQTVGLVASNTKYLSGAITWDAAEKGARFIRFCDCFNIPLVFIGDSPAYMVGSNQERNGMIARGSSMVFATAEATVPKIAVCIRRTTTAASYSLGALPIGGDLVFFWPAKEVTGFGPEIVTDIIYRKQIAASENPEEARKLKIEQVARELGDVYDMASWEQCNDVIEPAETRVIIIKALKMLKNKVVFQPQKKYGNIPL